MFLKSLKLVNFRNFATAKLNFLSTTVLIGNNAQGKTNLLESIYFLATARSLRAEKDIQLIKHGEGFCRVEGEIEGTTKLEIVMQIVPEAEGKVEKRVKVNGVSRRVGDYVGNLVAVFFSPEDINLVAGAPSLRRDYLDLTLSQIDRDYKQALSTYGAALTSRNRLLKKIKEGEAKISELDFWTEQLIESGQVVSQKRENLFKNFNQQLLVLGGSKSLGNFYLDYQPSPLSDEKVEQYLSREIEAAMTLIGPHRDDFLFELNGQNLAFFGSRGEQRTAVLDLKLAELNFVKGVIGSEPVLLLDDIFSELDEDHRQYVTSVIGSQQTIISAVENEQIPGSLLKEAKVVRIEKGKLLKK